ncbi:hypothetical protein [Pontibacter sp. G13]|uniref:hypothetical protein n=1 Tax=Pontibacter sp. G13 TaxID=3074898 RepID=UPI00288C44B0|nr:hypothetical protein [Pontibacter sp. G13]WNJ21304.1 hypothetical protein RJD25_12615 [Pontibacter sp. G13]
MNILVNDANILIDLIKLDFMDAFMKLEARLMTTDFVLNELDPDQQKLLGPYLENHSLTSISTESVDDFQGIYQLLGAHTGLSFEDCSVWYYSIQLAATLVTGDGKLRKTARKSGVEVRGIIFLFDEMLAQGVITKQLAIEKMQALRALNPRLPQQEMERRLKQWHDGEA